MKDIIIVGAGPAGLTAAIYALRAGMNITIFEALAYGGKIVNAKEVENYPAIEKISGYDLATNMYQQVKKLGAEIIYEKVIGIEDLKDYKIVKTVNAQYQARAVILATGVQTRKLGLDKEDILLGRGVSYCATCDGPFFEDQDVAVVGGGNSAIEDALYLVNYCHKVYVIYRNEKIRSESVLLEKLKGYNNVEFILNSNVTELKGVDSLESVLVKNNLTNLETELKITGLFIAIGQIPENNNFAKLIELNDNGYIIGDESCHTNIPGIYVAGDTREKIVRQLTTATADGTIAALTAIKEMQKNAH